MTVHLHAHVEHLSAAGHSQMTIQARIHVITRLSAHLGMDPTLATTPQISGWLARPGWARITRATYRLHIRGYCGWAYRSDLAEADPSATLGKVRVAAGPPRPVRSEVLARIMTRAQAPYLPYYALAAYAGLRCCEVVVLDREDITQEQVTVHGKGGKTRLVPTHPVVWRHVAPLPLGPIWHLAGKGYPPHVAAHKLSGYANRQLARIGCPGVTMHMLRHWFGSNTFRLSRNIRATQELLGHASVVTTQRYTEVSDEERRLAVEALPAVA